MKKIINFVLVLAILGLLVFGAYYIYTIQQEKKLDNKNEDLTSFAISLPVVAPIEEPIAVQPVDNSINLLMVGDTGLLEPLGSRVVNDPEYNPFTKVKALFSKMDYVVATLEATIDGASVGSPNPGKAYTFSTPKESVKVFKDAGIDAFSYASNHAKDYGPNSVNHTIELLNSAGIGTFGAGANNNAAYTPHIVNIKGVNITFLGFNCMEYAFNHSTETEAGTASFSEWRVRDSISKAKAQSDILIVFAHWGEEHTQELDPEWQVQWANIFTSAGADIVIGGHPHVRQKQDTVNGKPVFYSIGNFAYPGQGGDPESLIGNAVEIIIEDKKISNLVVHTTYQDNDGVPYL